MLRLIDRRMLAVLVLACAVAGCDDEATPTQPTQPPPTVTDTFTGAVTQNGATTHSFSTAAGGTVTATLKTVTPDDTIAIGFSLGNWNATTSSCNVVLANDGAKLGAILTGTMTASGSLCVRLYDVGNVSAGTPSSYSVEVVHP